MKRKNNVKRKTYLGDVPGHRGVVKVIVDVVVNTAGHAMEELGHALAPASGGTPDWTKQVSEAHTDHKG
jgi:hypothetical protein